MSGFEQLGIEAWLARQCAYMALHDPTPIQNACIPAVLAGNHVVGGAATGSGKTAAFALPILQALSADVYGVFALVLTPSRELAYQIADQFIALGAPLRARTMLAIGGVRHEEQVDAMKSRPPIVVATPGRLLHLLTTFQKEVRPAFGYLRFLVMDEADWLTDGAIGGTVRDVLRVLPPTPRRQVLLFTATLEERLTTLPAMTTTAVAAENNGDARAEREYDEEASWLELLGVRAAERKLVVCNVCRHSDGTTAEAAAARTRHGSDGGNINREGDEDGDDDGDEEQRGSIHGTRATAATGSTLTTASITSTSLPISFPSTLQQCYVFIPDMVKLPNLVAALRALGKEQSTIVFANSCLRAELVRLALQLLGFPVCSLDSLLTQQHRLDNLAMFKLGLAKILVATDIAARGLDIPVVSTVIHYDAPKHATTYVHRVGRTARAGKAGLSVVLVTEHDVELIQRIERRLAVRLEKWKQPALREEYIIKILDEVSAAKVQAKQQVTEQFGQRRVKLKEQANARRDERNVAAAVAATARSAMKRNRTEPEEHEDEEHSSRHSNSGSIGKRSSYRNDSHHNNGNTVASEARSAKAARRLDPLPASQQAAATSGRQARAGKAKTARRA